MFRYRVPLVIRALALFLASLPVARFSMAGATGAHGLGTLPAREAQVPPGAAWVRPAPEAIAVTAVGVALTGAGTLVTQRAHQHLYGATPAQVTQREARATVRPVAVRLQHEVAPWGAMVLPVAALSLQAGRVGVPDLPRSPYLSTTVRARAP